ncbi:hypothetical protein M2360_004895 [Rhizobium sp. SG_E_25_P2]|uniref:hypothetical protein n=1 Tax=Rhizobium sp. SG_E_25_P2 TaxID=2879942 RepID=UPI00247443C1|nr:hypothetical protein [Rhizobium sp. SG_E_25_P2]MDH6269467.1 hypothetical protein [Rhizobium sp. SG_E_25_P2]
MAIGDLIIGRIGTPRTLRFVGTSRPSATRPVALEPIFSEVPIDEYEEIEPQHKYRWLPWPGAAASSQQQRKRRSHSLIDVVRTYTNRLTYGLANGSETIEVPYNHIICQSSKGGIFDPDANPSIESDIESRLAMECKGLYDVNVGIHVACQVSDRLANQDVEMFLGPGIFVPQRDEQPVGWLRFYPDRENPARYNEPSFEYGQRAALYRRQTGLSFSIDHAVTPATLPFNTQNDGRATHFNLTSLPPGRATAGHWANLQSGGKSRTRPILSAQPSPAPGVDQSWRVDFISENRPPARLDLCLDRRPSRLWRHPPAGNPFEILEIRLDLQDIGDQTSRLWVDLDAGGMLIGSAFSQPASSICWEAGAISIYDWSKYRFDERSGRGLVAQESSRDFIRLVRHDRKPLGYLSLPATEMSVLFFEEFWLHDAYHLDWLDFSGGIEFADGKKVGLAAAFANAGDTDRWASSRSIGREVGRVASRTLWQIGPLVVAAMEG